MPKTEPYGRGGRHRFIIDLYDYMRDHKRPKTIVQVRQGMGFPPCVRGWNGEDGINKQLRRGLRVLVDLGKVIEDPGPGLDEPQRGHKTLYYWYKQEAD